jgi:hypothetical protein
MKETHCWLAGKGWMRGVAPVDLGRADGTGGKEEDGPSIVRETADVENVGSLGGADFG